MIGGSHPPVVASVRFGLDYRSHVWYNRPVQELTIRGGSSVTVGAIPRHAVTSSTGPADETAGDFDHDAYVRERLPNFVLAGMGLRPNDPTREPLTSVVQTTEPVEHVTPNSSDLTHCVQHVSPVDRSRPPDKRVERSEPIRPSNPRQPTPRADDEIPPARSPSVVTVLGPNSRLGRQHITPADHNDRDNGNERSHTRDQQLTQLARQTVTGVLAIPLVLIVLILFFGLLFGSPGEDPSIVVNDEHRCTSTPLTVSPNELATREYWKEC